MANYYDALVFLNNGDGTFQSAVSYDVGDEVERCAVLVAEQGRVDIGPDRGTVPVQVSLLESIGRLFAGEEAMSEFGERFFVLPNPLYGSWEHNPPE